MSGTAPLAPYAAPDRRPAARTHPEPEHTFRAPFQRDRDRILHSSAFRRLEFKTQVFLPFEGDYYRTRLTHTLEVAQISRTAARALGLNEDLAEAIALAHDLGHSPFGHAGEFVLHELMRGRGGFEHNRQSLRIVDKLESRYPDFPGLNLTFEVREGIMKHRTAYDDPAASKEFPHDLRPTLEAQIVNLADEITYSSHDVDDGVKSGIIAEEMLAEVPITRRILETMTRPEFAADPRLRRHQLIRSLIDIQVTDLLDQTRRNIKRLRPADLDAVRRAPSELAAFSPELAEEHAQLKAFLQKAFYMHARVRRRAGLARDVITDLFQAYVKNPELLPDQPYLAAHQPPSIHRAACDYVAGMTDRFALAQRRRIQRDAPGRKQRNIDFY